MATLKEIREKIFDDPGLINKCESAVIIAIREILSGTPTDDQKELAKKAINDTTGYAKKALLMVIASKNTSTVEDILSLEDEVLITEVKAAVLLFTGA